MSTDQALVSGVVRQRFPCIDASWRTYIYGVIYVPATAQQHLATLKREGGKAFLLELDKMAALGSPWASAFLGYQALLLRPDGTRDIDRAIQLCQQPAVSGDAYASYIAGWANFLRGDSTEAMTHLRRATRQMFPPAMLDQISFFWISHWRTDPARVLVSIEHAKNVGHRATIVFRSSIYPTGNLGFGRLLLGYLLAPLAYLYFHVASWRDTFSAQSFAFHPKTPSRALGLRD